MNRLDTKNWTPTPDELSRDLAERVADVASRVDVLLLMDQVELPDKQAWRERAEAPPDELDQAERRADTAAGAGTPERADAPAMAPDAGADAHTDRLDVPAQAAGAHDADAPTASGTAASGTAAPGTPDVNAGPDAGPDGPDAGLVPRAEAEEIRRTWREVGFAAVHVASAPGSYRGLEVTILTADFGVRG